MRSETAQALERAVDNLRNDMTATLQKLVSIPSVIGDEGQAQEFMRRTYEALGLDVKILYADRAKVSSHPAFCDTGKPFEGRPNVIGVLKGDPRKKSIILNGHVDVVSAEPIAQWKHDPWGGDVEGNKLYGRGAADMKGGLIANLFALKALRKIGLQPGGTVMLQSVIEEEDGGGGGALACFMEGYTADGMIVTEPAAWVNVALAGIMRCMVRVKGKSAHPAQSQLGVNAIGKILPIYQALEQLDLRRKAEVKFPLFQEPVPGSPACHLIVGTLHAGDHIATVPGFAELGCRVGFIPGETGKGIRELVEGTIQEAAKRDPWLRDHPPEVKWLPFQAEPFYQDPNHPFVRTVISSAQAVAGQAMEVKPKGATWTEDTRFANGFGFPALSMGPVGERPHGVDECVDLDSMTRLIKALAMATINWCSTDK
jgi:acetylornithine deacetylase